MSDDRRVERRSRGHVAATAATRALDDTDRRLVEGLVRDGRMSVRALAESVHISRAHAYARLERLHDSGIIEGYAAQLDFDAGWRVRWPATCRWYSGFATATSSTAGSPTWSPTTSSIPR